MNQARKLEPYEPKRSLSNARFRSHDKGKEKEKYNAKESRKLSPLLASESNSSSESDSESEELLESPPPTTQLESSDDSQSQSDSDTDESSSESSSSAESMEELSDSSSAEAPELPKTVLKEVDEVRTVQPTSIEALKRPLRKAFSEDALPVNSDEIIIKIEDEPVDEIRVPLPEADKENPCVILHSIIPSSILLFDTCLFTRSYRPFAILSLTVCLA